MSTSDTPMADSAFILLLSQPHSHEVEKAYNRMRVLERKLYAQRKIASHYAKEAGALQVQAVKLKAQNRHLKEVAEFHKSK